MAKSMTGYGRSEISSKHIYGYVEVKSKNHRHKDIKVSLPGSFSSFEIPLQKMITARVFRVKVDLHIKISAYMKSDYTLKLNKELLGEYKKIFGELRAELGATGDIDIVNVSKLQDLVVMVEDEGAVKEHFKEIKEAVAAALDALDEMKIFEGKKLVRELDSFMLSIKECTAEIKLKRETLAGAYYEKIKSKITKLLGESGLDENRLYQEVAYIIDKTDITEELARLNSHLEQYDIIIKEDGAIGKKLDFLFQELNREINTIASKANDFGIVSSALKIKNEVEKSREQACNIE